MFQKWLMQSLIAISQSRRLKLYWTARKGHKSKQAVHVVPDKHMNVMHIWENIPMSEIHFQTVSNGAGETET